MNELLVAVGLIVGVIAAHEIGFWLGSLKRKTDEPFDRQIALVAHLRPLSLRSWSALHFRAQHRVSPIG